MTELLAVDDARIDVDDVPAVDGLVLVTTADRTLVLGAPRALFEAAAGLRAVARGHVKILGRRPGEAVAERLVAAAPFDPALPPAWTPLEYATWSARLAGVEPPLAAAQARDAAERVQLGDLAKQTIGRLLPHARRATVVAAALATGAGALVLDDPLGGLAEDLARPWGDMLVKALAGKPWVVFAPRAPLTSPLVMAADEAIVVSGSRIDARGAPASLASASRRYVARVHGALEPFAARLAERGAKVEADGARLVVDLGDALSTHEVLALARDAEVVVVELTPIARALA